jgi:ubiquitin C-terminal hydrolase
MPCNKVEASKRMTIEKLPEVLIVQLKRFTFDERGLYKIRKFISYPMEWVIDRALFTNPKLAPPDEERRYQLVSGKLAHSTFTIQKND